MLHALISTPYSPYALTTSSCAFEVVFAATTAVPLLSVSSTKKCTSPAAHSRTAVCAHSTVTPPLQSTYPSMSGTTLSTAFSVT